MATVATPMNSAGTATTKPAIGPAMPMSNSARLLGNRLADADERAERAGQRRGGTGRKNGSVASTS